MSKRFFALILCLLLMAGCTAGNSKTKSDPVENSPSESPASAQPQASAEEDKKSAEKNDIIVHGIVDEVVGLFHPLLAYITTDSDLNSIIYPSLMRFTGDNSLEPYFAESLDISEDGLKFTYKLKENAIWHDGNPVTAEDVIFTFTSMANPGLTTGKFKNVETIKGAKAFYESTTDTVEGIYATDPYTVVIEFDEVASTSYTNLSTTGIFPKHIWEAIPIETWEEQTELLHNPIGFGPYKVVEYVPGQHVEMIKHNDFFDGEAETDTIVFKIINPNSIMAELKSQTIDIVPNKNLRTIDIEEATSNMSYENIFFPDRMYRYIGINLRLDIFQEKALRQAMMYGIDRQLLVDKILEGRGNVIDGPFMPTSWAYPKGLERYTKDIDKAKALLEGAGFSDTDGDGILESSTGEKLSFTYKMPNNSSTLEQVMLVIQQEWKALGIQIEILPMEYNAVADECIFNHDFDLYSLNCVINADASLMNWWHSKSATDEKGVGSWNFGAYKNDQVDTLLNTISTAAKQEDQIPLYQEIAEILHEDVPMIFLYVQDSGTVYHEGLKNYNPSTFNIYYDIHKWILER